MIISMYEICLLEQKMENGLEIKKSDKLLANYRVIHKDLLKVPLNKSDISRH